jgi:hypothetical protein
VEFLIQVRPQVQVVLLVTQHLAARHNLALVLLVREFAQAVVVVAPQFLQTVLLAMGQTV